MMADENPYESPFAKAHNESKIVRVFYWRIPFLIVAAAIASFPFYGYFVHAARDSQQTALLIMFCWLLNLIFIIGSIVVAVVRPPNSESAGRTAILLIVYMMIAGFIGLGGVGSAIVELLAG
jgi:hypothetical protein